MATTRRTHVCRIQNHSQVVDALDRHGWSASKLWNVANYYARQQWDETGEIPDEDELKTHSKYNGLHSQSSQNVLEELSEAFGSWYGSDDDRDTPPGYRKENHYDDHGNRVHEEHPRSTITWRTNGIRHDDRHDRLRLILSAVSQLRYSPPRGGEYLETVTADSISKGSIDLLLRVNAEESDHRIRAVDALRFQPALGGNRRHTGGTLVCLPRRAVARPMRPHRSPCHCRANHRSSPPLVVRGRHLTDSVASVLTGATGLNPSANRPSVARPPPEDGGMRSQLYQTTNANRDSSTRFGG